LDERRLIGFTALRHDRRLFPCPGQRNLVPTVRLDKLPRFIPSCSRSSSEFLRSLSRPLPFGSRLTARVSALFATRPAASTHLEGSQVLDTFRPQVFSTSRRFPPQAGSTGLFHPAAASRVHGSFRDLPSRAAIVTSSGRPAPSPLFDGRSRGRIPTATAGALGLEALIRAGARARRGWRLNRPRGRFPLRVSSPPGPVLPPCSRFTRDLRSWSYTGQTYARTRVRARAWPPPPPAYCQRGAWLVRHRTSRPARDFEPT